MKYQNPKALATAISVQDICLALLLAIVMITSVGCGAGEPDPRGERYSVRGTVQLDGQPLTDAVIRFLPADGNAILKASGTIKNGEFNIDPEHGPLAGLNRVEIHPHSLELETFEAQRAKTRTAFKPSQLEIVKIPAHYNMKSELTCVVESDGENKFDFQLKSKP